MTMTFPLGNIDEMEPSSTWLPRVLNAPSPDETTFYRRLEMLTAQEAVDFLTGTILPEAAQKYLRQFNRDVVANILTRGDLMPEHIRQVFTLYVSYGRDETLAAELPRWTQFDDLLPRLAAIRGVSVSELGTLCRTLDKYTQMRRSVLNEHVATALLDAENCPMEVVARIHQYPGDSSRFDSPSYWPENFYPRARALYPDLDGLPAGMLLDVLATQPIPDAWFLDAWDVGEPVENRRGKNSYLINGDLLWMDLTEER